jgi:alpha-ketoglutarate-dependent taurine dioxygenase
MNKLIKKIDSLSQLRDNLEKKPVVILQNGDGNIQHIYDVVNFLNGEKTLNGSVGASDSFHPPHTDSVYVTKTPAHILLQCVVPDKNGGGLGLYWDIDLLLKYVPEKYLTVLTDFPIKYERLREDGQTIDKYEGYILKKEVDSEKYAIKWRYDHTVRPQLNTISSNKENVLFEETIAWVNNFLQTQLPEKVTYKCGDIVICSNMYVLHGRTKILDTNRVFRRCWLNVA